MPVPVCVPVPDPNQNLVASLAPLRFAVDENSAQLHVPGTGTGTFLQLRAHIQMKPQAPHHFIPTQHPKKHTISDDQNPPIATRQKR